MSKFKRRPFMAGHTDVFVMSQPYITGTEHINSSGLLDSVEALTSGVTQFELSFETEAGSGNFQLDVAVTAEEDRTLAAIVTALNADFGASSVSSLIEASDFEGCLRIQSLGSGFVDTNGDGAADTLSYIKILPNDSGSSFVDGADLFGFPSFPHPTAVVTAGDLAHSPVRPLTQINRPGAAFIARGEDRVSQNFNRALHQLSINEDSLNTRLKARVPVPTVLDIDRTSTRLLKDASDRIVGLTLYGTHSDSLDSILGEESRVFVGGLSNASSLLEIANFFSVQDQEDNQIQADQRVVRVGAVTSGYTGVISVPTFVSESGAPTSGVSDSTVPLDNGNLLGLQYEKTAATVISLIKDGCVLVCDSATFSTDGVIKGDLVTIAGSTITAPITHNGTYYVETVISETELEVRPVDHDNVLILNESESGGLGSATVTTDGSFAQNVVLMFSPPIADFPPDRVAEDGTTPITGVLRIVLGLEAPLGEVPSEFLARSTVKTAAEVDAFVTRRVWRRMSFDGLYQGQSYDFRGSQQGGGAEGRITHGPISLSISSDRDRPSALTAEMTGTGSLEMRGNDLVLTADPTYVFSDTDIGKVVFVSDTGGSLFADETPFVLSEFLSYREIRLTPPVDYKDWRTSDLAGSTSCSFEVVGEGQAAIQAAMLFVANDKTPTEEDAAKTGLVFIRNHRDGADGDVSPGTSHLHLERVRNVKTWDTVSTTDADARFLSVATNAGARTAILTGATASDIVHPKYNTHIFHATNAVVSSPNGVGCTLLRIVNGPNAGFYEIDELISDTGLFSVQPIENAFDGSTSWSGFVSTSVTEVANLYNVVFSVGGKRTSHDPVLGELEVTSGVTAFADAADKVGEGAYTPSTGVARAIQAHWIGEGSALHVRVNDPDFYAISAENNSTGYAIDVRTYNPAAGGHIRAHGAVSNPNATSRFAQGLKVFTDSNVLSAFRDSSSDPFSLISATWGAGLTAVSQWTDPAAFIGIGYAENAEEGVPNVGDSAQNSSSALVLRDARGFTTSQQEVPVGVFQGALTYTGAVSGSTNSPLVSMSSIASSIAVLPVFGGKSLNAIGFTTGYGDSDQPIVLNQRYTLGIQGLGRYGREGATAYFESFSETWAQTDPGSNDATHLGAPTWTIGDYNSSHSGIHYGGTNVVWSEADYSTFGMKHNFCVEVTVSGSISWQVHTLPGRLAWMGFDTTGATTQDVSYLYRVEAVACIDTATGVFKIALRSDEDPSAAPKNPATLSPTAGATLTSLGFKAARWNRSYIDLADRMTLGTALGTNTESMLPVLGTTRGLDRGLNDSIGSIWNRGYEHTWHTDSWADRYPSSYQDLVLRQGSIGPRRISLNVEGTSYYGSFDKIGDTDAFNDSNIVGVCSLPTPSFYLAGRTGSLWYDPYHPFDTLVAPSTGQAAAPFSSEFIFAGENPKMTAWNNWYSPGSDFSLQTGELAGNRSMRHRDIHFTKVNLNQPSTASFRSELTAAGMLAGSSNFAARWSPSRGGALTMTLGDGSGTEAAVELIRIWIPVGRNIEKENFFLQFEMIASSFHEKGALNPQFNRESGDYLRVALRDPSGHPLCTRGIHLTPSQQSSSSSPLRNDPPFFSGTAETLWAKSVELQSVEQEGPSSLDDGALSATHGDLAGNVHDREVPLFVTVDVLLGTYAAYQAAVAVAADPKMSFTDTVENLVRESPVFFEDLLIGIGSAWICPGINFHVLQASPGKARDAHLSSGLEVGGVLSAKSIRLREPRRSLTTYCHEARFLTGSVYANVYSDGVGATSDRHGNYEDSTYFGQTTAEGQGSVVGLIQPYVGIDHNEVGPKLSLAWPAPGPTTLDKRTIYSGAANSFVNYVSGQSISDSGGNNSEFQAVTATSAEVSLPNGGSHDSGADPGSSISADPWLSPNIPPQSMVYGPNGPQIIGGNWSDPLWYQQAILIQHTSFDGSFRAAGSLMRPLVSNQTEVGSSTVDQPAFFIDPVRVVQPSPTGFLIPLSGINRGDILQEVGFHVSISPHVWSQQNVFGKIGGAVGTQAGSTISDLSSRQWWLNEWRQADWGVYYELPYSDDGLTAGLATPDSGSIRPPLISHHVEAWQPRGGFIVEIWQSPIGIDFTSTAGAESRDAGIVNDGKSNGVAKRLSRKVVKLTELFGDDDAGSDLENYHPASRSTITTSNRVSRYNSDGHSNPLRGASELLAQNGSTRIQANGEIHVKGSIKASSMAFHSSESTAPPPASPFRLDPSAFSYFVIVKFYLGGARVYGSSNKLITDTNPLLGSGVDMYFAAEGQASTDIGWGGQGYGAFAKGRNLRVVPPPHGLPTDPTPPGVSRLGESYRTLPSVTLKGIRTSILTEKP